MENESSQKKEIRQNKEEMKAEKKASTNKVLLWIIGLIVVAAFAWFVWPTPWVTKIKYDYRATSVHKINRITGAICQTVLQSDGYVKRGNCWKRKIDHEDSRFAWLENGRGEPKLQAIDYEKGHIKTTGYLREDLGDSKYFDAKLYNGNEARVAELEVTIKCGDMSQKYLLKGSIKKFSFGEMTTEIDSAIYDCAASTRKWNFYANAIRGYYN